MGEGLLTYQLETSFKVVTILFVLFLLLIENLQGRIGVLFFANIVEEESNSDKFSLISLPNLLITLLSSFTFSLFINVLGFTFSEIGGFLGLLLDAGVLLGLLLLKVLVNYFSAVVLDEKTLFKAVDREMVSYLCVMTVTCLFLTFVVLNYNLDSYRWVFFMIVLVEMLWYVRLSIVVIGVSTFNILYFFSYLCSLEIIPTLALAVYLGII